MTRQKKQKQKKQKQKKNENKKNKREEEKGKNIFWVGCVIHFSNSWIMDRMQHKDIFEERNV